MVSILLLLIFGTVSIIVAIQRIIVGKAHHSYFFECAFAVDLLGNVLGQHLWNLILIQDEGYKFGNRRETMSSALGKNERDNTLRWCGKITVSILELFEKNHSLISIDV